MVKRETPSPRKMFGSASCQHLVVLQWYGKPVGMLCIIYIKSITLGGGISYGALLMWNLVNFHLGWFTKKGTHKSPQKSVFSAFYERFWDLWGPFLGDQPKWKISMMNTFPQLKKDRLTFNATCFSYKISSWSCGQGASKP